MLFLQLFLLDHILDFVNQKGPAFERAAQISPFINSITLGPNSSYRVPVVEEKTLSDHEFSEKKTPKQKENLPPKTSPISTMSVTTNDLEFLRMKLQGQTEERNLREKVQKLLEERAAKEREHEERMQMKVDAMKLEVERKYMERIENLEKQLAMALKIEEQEELSYQNHRTELTKNARKVIEQQEKELLESTKRFEEDFNKHEANFNQVVRACNQANSKAIDSYKMQFEAIKAKKTASRSLGSLKNACIEADEICNGLKIANKAFEENMKALKEAEAQKAAAEVEKTKIAAQAIIVPQPQLPPPSASDQQIHTPSETKRQYTELMQFLSEKQNATKHFREAEQFQELRFRLKVAVNGPINHLNEQNKNSLIEGFQKLQSLLSGQKVCGSKGEVSVTEHPEATDWTKLRIAEKLIDVGDKKKEAVYFIAAITVALWQQFPDFGQMFLAQLFKECPFLVPHKPGQMTNQSDIDFLRSWGYRVTDKAEEYKIYQDRTSNYAQLLAAVWITSSRRNVSASHPYGIDNGWTYLVNIMRSDPDPMYLHFIDKVFEIAGSTLQSTYGHQFKKLVFLVHNSYLRALEGRVDEGMKAAWDRLDVMVVKFFNEGKFEKPAKKLPGNFW